MHSNSRQYQLTMHLFGLFIKCPFRETTPNCPFDYIRSLQSLDLKFHLAERIAMHPQCSENVRNIHEACYRARIQQMFKVCPQERDGASESRRKKPSLYDQTATSRG